MIAAILKAQLLSMRLGASRGLALSMITAVLWYGLWCFLASVAFLTASATDAVTLDFSLPIAFFAIFAYWQFVPVLSASMGSALDMRKLLVYPAPHGKLFLVEVLLRLTAGAEMVLILAGGTAGLLRNPAAGGWAAAVRLPVVVLLFVLFNLLLASGMRSVVERLLSRRRVREALVLVMVSLWMLPRLLFMSGGRPKWLPEAGSALGMFGWPWSAAARAGFGRLPHAPAESAWLALVCLCGWALAAAWFGRTQFERSLRYDMAAAQATPLGAAAAPGRPFLERFYRFPGLVWRDPLAGIVEKELRSLARTPRFRMVFILGFTFGLLVWLPMMAGRPLRPSAFSRYFLTTVCVYALTLLGQVTYWNCFGFDRSAVQIYFVAPQPLSRTLLGKNIACMVYIYLEVLILTGITAALGLTAGWSHVAETLVVVGICSLYMLAFGNISSVHYPRVLNAERVSQGGASSRFQALIFISYPVALLPVFLAYLARYAFDSQAVFWLALAFAAGIGVVLYRAATDSAVAAAGRRRESLVQELSGGGGPVVSD